MNVSIAMLTIIMGRVVYTLRLLIDCVSKVHLHPLWGGDVEGGVMTLGDGVGMISEVGAGMILGEGAGVIETLGVGVVLVDLTTEDAVLVGRMVEDEVIR